MGEGGNSTSLFIPNLKHGHLYTSTFDELFGATLDVNKTPCPGIPVKWCRNENFACEVALQPSSSSLPARKLARQRGNHGSDTVGQRQQRQAPCHRPGPPPTTAASAELAMCASHAKWHPTACPQSPASAPAMLDLPTRLLHLQGTRGLLGRWCSNESLLHSTRARTTREGTRKSAPFACW